MARPVYNYELADPDLSWLISNFQENNPNFILLESSCLPIVFIKGTEECPSAEYSALPDAPAIKPNTLPEKR